MTSKHNISSYDYSKFQSSTSNPHYLNPGFPNRKPTEGEIDQFIELLKNSSTGNQSDGNNQDNANLRFDQCGDSDLRSEIPDSAVGSLPYKPNSRVILNDDGILMKTIHVQSPENSKRESERFGQEPSHEHDFKDNSSYQNLKKSYKSSSAFSQTSNDYLRKTTYLNEKSKLKVTISRDQEKTQSYSSGFESRELSSSSDIDTRIISEEMMYSKNLMEKETYSRDLGRSPHVKERFADEFWDSSSYSKLSKPNLVDSDLRTSPIPSMNTQRRSYSGDLRNPREGSPYYYSESNRSRNRKDISPNQSCYPHGREKHSRYPTRSPQRSRTPSPHRRKRDSRDRELYNPHAEDSFSDYDSRIHSPEMKERRSDVRFDTKNSPFAVPSPPSPPPPPVLSALKKKKSKPKADQEKSKSNKSTNPLTTLLADRNVSISTLLEAAIGNTGEKSSSTDWDPSAKADILARCEEKIGQLYRHRVSGPGSFIPNTVPRPLPLNVNCSTIVKHYPKLEMSSKPTNDFWHCPTVVVPQPQQIQEIISDEGDQILSTRSGDSSKSKSKKTSSNGDDNDVHSEVPRMQSRIPFESTVGPSISTFETSVSYRSDSLAPPGDYINSSEQWQQFGNDESRCQYNANDNSYSLYQQPPPPLNPSGTYDPHNWSNSGAFNTFGYQQPQFENQQLVQYPVGHQPVGPQSQYMNNPNYFVGQNENPQFPAGPTCGPVLFPPIGQDMPHFPGAAPPLPDQWYPQNEQNIQFPETVQYPLKQRSNLTSNNDSKNSQLKNNPKFVNPNLISLTGNQAAVVKKATSPPLLEQISLIEREPVSSSEDKNKLKKTSSIRCLVTPKISDGKHQEMGKRDLLMEKILQLNVKIRSIQVNDERTYNIIKDLESGPKIYSYAYTIQHRMLWRKDLNDYKIYISEPIEKAMLILFHESFHDMNEIELEALTKEFLTIIPRIQEKLRYTLRSCSMCRRGAEMISVGEHSGSPKRMVSAKKNDHSLMRRSRSPHSRSNRSPLSHIITGNRSRSPSKKRQLHHPPSKKPSSKSTGSPISKDRIGAGRDRSPSPYHQRHESSSLKRRRDSRSRERRDRSRRRSRHRRSPSFGRHRMESRSHTERKGSNLQRDQSGYKRHRPAESPEVEAIAVIKLPSKDIEVIDLVEEDINETEDQWISYDSTGSENEEDGDDNVSNKDTTVKTLDSKEKNEKNLKQNESKESLIDEQETDKCTEQKNEDNTLKEENQIQELDSDVNKEEDKVQEETVDKQKQTQKTSDQKLENTLKENSNQEEQKKEIENANVNETGSTLEKDFSGCSRQEGTPEEENSNQQKQEKEESVQNEEHDKNSIEEIAPEKKGDNEASDGSVQSQESKDEDKSKNNSTNSQKEEGQILQTKTEDNEDGNGSVQSQESKDEDKSKNNSTNSQKEDQILQANTEDNEDGNGSAQSQGSKDEDKSANSQKEEGQILQTNTEDNEDGNGSVQSQESKDEDKSENNSTNSQKEEDQILQTNTEDNEDGNGSAQSQGSKDEDKSANSQKEEGQILQTNTEDNEDGNGSAQSQESKGEDKSKNNSTNSQKKEGQILQTNVEEKKDGAKEYNVTNTNSEKQGNKPLPMLDFKTRVRNIQLLNKELKNIIDCLDGNKKDITIDPCYLMKGGMLCKKCQVGVKSEIRIAAANEQINDLVLAVHTMSSIHAPLQKTLMLFNKHFIPMPDIDKIVEEVVNGCQTCN